MSTREVAFARFRTAYADNSVLRVVVNLIPNVGGAIDAYLSVGAGRIANARMQSLIDELKASFAKLEESAIRRDFVESDEFGHLVVETLRITSRSRTLDRIRRLARFVSATTTRVMDFDRTEQLLELVERLTDTEFQLAAVILRLERETPRTTEHNDLQHTTSFWERLPGLTGLTVEFLPGLLASAAGKGALREYVGGFFDYDGGKYHTTLEFEELCLMIGFESLLEEHAAERRSAKGDTST